MTGSMNIKPRKKDITKKDGLNGKVRNKQRQIKLTL